MGLRAWLRARSARSRNPEGCQIVAGGPRAARGPPEGVIRIVSTPEGCQNRCASTRKNDYLCWLRKGCGGFLVGLEWVGGDAGALSPLGGEINLSWRTGGRSSALRPPATFWQPSGLRGPTRL